MYTAMKLKSMTDDLYEKFKGSQLSNLSCITGGECNTCLPSGADDIRTGPIVGGDTTSCSGETDSDNDDPCL